MVGVLLNGLINIRGGVFSKHAPEVCSGNAVPEVADHGVDMKGFSVSVPVHAPRVCCAVGYDFKVMGFWMESPDTDIDGSSLGIRCSRLADERSAQNALTAIEPAVGAPGKSVGHGVTCSGVIETVEENFGFLIGNIVVISVGQKDHFR